MKAIKPVTVTVHSVIDNLEDGLPVGEPEINTFSVPGSLADDGERLTLRYGEDGEDGQHTDCLLCLTADGVMLTRRGSVVVDLLFAEGEECHALYAVPPYKFDMTVRTRRIRRTLSYEGGELQLIYSMNVGGQDKDVRMRISVTP